MHPDDPRPLGTTGVSVTALGLGTAAIGGLFEPVSEAQAHATVRRAWESGTRFFDTAPLYGHGHSEQRLGRALQDLPRDELVVSTKVGRLLRPGQGETIFRDVPAVHPVFDFSGPGIRRSLEESLERLGLDRVDVVHIHDPDDHADQALQESYPVLDELRRSGVVRAIGAGMNQTGVLARFAREAAFDCFLLAGRYTLLDQSGLDELLPICSAKGIGVVVGGVYNSGVLARPEVGAPYDYAPAAPDVLSRVESIAEVCRHHGVPLMAAAIQFPFGHPAVTSILSGARSEDEVEQNRRMLQTPLPPALWDDLKDQRLIRRDAPTPAEPVPHAGTRR